MPDTSLLPIGVITKAHGIRGEVSVDYYAESPRLLRGTIFLQSGTAPPLPAKVESVRSQQERLLVRFAGIDDRNAAERMRGQTILVPKEALPPLTDDELYLHDVIGLRVIVHEEGAAPKVLGELTDIAMPAGQELWTITTPEGREVLFPAVPELVDRFDLDAGEVHITPPPGLLELYLS